MHTGSINGLCALIGLIPQKRVGVYVLENLDHAELRHALMYRVFDMYNRADGTVSSHSPPRDWSADLKTLFDAQDAAMARRRSAAVNPALANTPALPLDRYVGTYVDSAYGNLDVTLVNGALSARFVNLEIGPLEHVGYDTFRSQPTKARERSTVVSFVQSGLGRVEAARAFGVTFERARNMAVVNR